MSRRVALTALSFAITLAAACTILPQYEFDKANAIITESNTLNTDGEALLKDALTKYATIYSEAQKAEDPFEELGAQSDAFKKLEPQIDSAKTKLHDASQKLDEASKLKLPDYFKQYLSNVSEINKSESTSADLALQLVRNTYDPNIKSPEDLDAKQKALNDKAAAETKRRDDLQAANKKIETEHKDDFKH